MNQTVNLKPGQIIKTKSGTKTWRVLGYDMFGNLRLEGVTNLKFRILNIDQFNKSWKVVE